GFTAIGIILVIMIGVGVAEVSGLIASLIRKLVAKSPRWSLTYIIVFLGIVSTIASDAGYLVLIPLGATSFKSVGRHPLAGMAAAFAGVAGGFGVNVLITPLDAVLTEITNESIHLVEPGRPIDLTANLWFGIGSTVMLTFLLVFVCTRLAEPRLGAYDPARRLRPGPGPIRRGARRRAGRVRRHLPGRGLARTALGRAGPARRDRAHPAAYAATRRSAARAGDRRHHRHLAVHGQPGHDDLAGLLRRRDRLRVRRRDHQNPHRSDQRDHQILGGPRRAATPVHA